MIIKHDKKFTEGCNVLTRADDNENATLMDYGVLLLGKDKTFIDNDKKEKAYLLVKGKALFEWEGNKLEVTRDSCFDEAPSCLHVPKDVAVKVTSLRDDTEISVTKTYNDRCFPPKFYTKEECRSEYRGEGTMKETSTRVVRTIFDYSNAPWANLVIGEVINCPGKWSSYPPHHHKQPEIYYYKFYPSMGYGFAQLGDTAIKVEDSDAVLIINDESHPQIAAPGYAMYYIWVIRHLDGNPYIAPTFEPEHLWVMEKTARIWPDRQEAI